MRPAEPGEVIAVALMAAGLASSALLARSGRHPVSTCVRAKLALRVVVAAGAVHLVFKVPHDPLTWLGGKVGRLKEP